MISFIQFKGIIAVLLGVYILSAPQLVLGGHTQGVALFPIEAHQLKELEKGASCLDDLDVYSAEATGGFSRIKPFIALLNDARHELLASIHPSLLAHTNNFKLPFKIPVGDFTQINMALSYGQGPSAFSIHMVSLENENAPGVPHPYRLPYAYYTHSQIDAPHMDFFEGVAVFPGATHVRLNLLTPPLADKVKNVLIYGQRHKYILTDCNLIEYNPKDGILDFNFPAVKKLSRIAAQGIEFNIEEVEQVYRYSRSLKPVKVTSQPFWIGASHPQRLAIIFKNGERKVFSTDGNDGLEVKFGSETGLLAIKVFAYHAAERPACVVQSIPIETTDGGLMRLHPDLAYTRNLPETNISVQLHDTPGILIPAEQPNGHVATMILTEHSDYTNSDNDPFVEYGNAEKILKAKKGMFGYNIPYTKTIFPIGDDYPFTANGIPFVQPSYEGNKNLQEMVNGYIKDGRNLEFGMHIGTYIKTATEMRQALEVAKQFNGNHIWIDHGTSPVNIYQDGWNKDMPEQYVLPLMREYGVKYIWTAASGDRFVPDKVEPFNNDYTLDGVPSGMLYRLPELENMAQHFDGNEPPWAPYIFRAMVRLPPKMNIIDDIISAKTVYIDHVYFGAPESAVRYEMADDVGLKISAHPEFQSFLESIDQERHKGNLYVDTLSKWAEYYLKSKLVRITFQEGRWNIHSNCSINGFTLISLPFPGDQACDLKIVEQPKKSIKRKIVDETRYLWFDLPAGETSLSIIKH